VLTRFLLLLLLLASAAHANESACFGTVSHGSLKDGARLPVSGPNYSAYSTLAAPLGRTWLHSKARDSVVEAYAALEKTTPAKHFVYGEAGWPTGGSFKPHKTHQNGTSLDFFVPVLDAAGRSVPLPASPVNKFGYAIEFDAQARYGGLTIDFEAMAEHLFELQKAAAARGAPIRLVIFDPRFLPKLFQTARGAQLRQSLKFMPKDAWVRHDEHYHVDFDLRCGPLAR
jgi:penicillin-insensitive murein endopeptidase